MLKFLLGLLTGGVGTTLLAVGIYSIYTAFTAMSGWLCVLLFILGAACLLFGHAMTKTVGEAMFIWSEFNKLYKKSEEDKDGKEAE